MSRSAGCFVTMIGERWTAYWFVLPGTILLAAILGFPAIASILESFGLQGAAVPAGSYVALLSDAQFLTASFNTALFVVCVVTLHIVLGLAVALLLNSPIRYLWFFRVVAILPWTVPDVIGGLIFRFMLDPLSGGVNALAIRLQLMQQPYDWLGNPDWAMFSVIMAETWRGYPYPMLILLAGLQAIPKEQYEAAAIDGAGAWATFTNVTLPSLMPMILIAVVLDVIWQCRLFGMIYGMTNGGPGDATQNLSLFVYRQYFQFFETSYAASAAVVLAAVLLTVAVPYIRATLREKD